MVTVERMNDISKDVLLRGILHDERDTEDEARIRASVVEAVAFLKKHGGILDTIAE